VAIQFFWIASSPIAPRNDVDEGWERKMGEDKSLVNIDFSNLSKPATVLIEKKI